MRVALEDATALAGVSRAVSDAGGLVTALDVAEPIEGKMIVDLTCNASDDEHAQQLKAAVDAVDGATVKVLSDRTFLMHIGGTIGIAPKVTLKSRDDLSMAYTPGVARISQAIADDPSKVRNLTIKRNTVAVVTDGSAVLGLGNIGPEAALPVMEGKALLFKQFANVDAWPVCLATQDVDEIVRIVQCIAPVYGGINLEDISAPRCFEIEARLRDLLDIPVFHDDQHGTAIVVFAALINALRIVKKEMKASPSPNCSWPRGWATSSVSTAAASSTRAIPNSMMTVSGWPRTPTRTSGAALSATRCVARTSSLACRGPI
jgi:malate dehydrogenase (oxaloacetate-decarboxylating)